MRGATIDFAFIYCKLPDRMSARVKLTRRVGTRKLGGILVIRRRD